MTGVEPGVTPSRETVTGADPHLLRELVEAGVVHIEGGELVASGACLELSRELLRGGVDLRTICQVVLLGGRLGQQVAAGLRDQVADIDGIPAAQTGLAVRVAAIALSEMLLGEQPAPPAPPRRIIDARDTPRPRLVPTQDR